MSQDKQIEQLQQSIETLTIGQTSSSTTSEFVSFAGKSLKLNEEHDVREIVDELNKLPTSNNDRVYVKLSGNTIGINAAKEIGRALKPISSLAVCCCCYCCCCISTNVVHHRLLIYQISSLEDLLKMFQLQCFHCVKH
jgi:Ran GTPase-activating protein (RanGAP) involved in mRNA processing and transport